MPSIHPLNDQTPRTPSELALRLATLLEESFGGKSAGRYFASTKSMKLLAGRAHLGHLYIEQLRDEALAIGVAVTPLPDGQGFGVCLASKLAGWRRLSRAAVAVLEADLRPRDSETLRRRWLDHLAARGGPSSDEQSDEPES